MELSSVQGNVNSSTLFFQCQHGARATYIRLEGNMAKKRGTPQILGFRTDTSDIENAVVKCFGFWSLCRRFPFFRVTD